MNDLHTVRIARPVLALVALVATLASAAGPSHAAAPEAQASEASPLRACADPDNLPFSSAGSGAKGLYVELAERIGEGLGRAVVPVWYRTDYAKRALRSTLLAGQCDFFVGLPAHDFMEKRLVMSKPFATLHYAIVTAGREPVKSAEDLRGKRVAVQLASPPQSMLAMQEGIQTLTVRTADDGLKALAEGKADAAYLWGPSAGYLNRTVHGGRFSVQAAEGKDFDWPVAVAFRRDDTALRDQVQGELDRLAPWIAEAEARYGFPERDEKRTALAAREEGARAVTPASGVLAQAGSVPVLPPRFESAPILLAQAGPVAGVGGGGGSIEIGRNLFNTNCSHCHGPDAASPDARIDLRRLGRRYHEDKDTVFNETVRQGRPDKGMPKWGGVLAEGDIVQIKAYVDSVQMK